MREEELEDVKQFKKTTISCYLRCLDGRSCWTTLISAFRVLLENDEDRLLVVFNRGLILMTESFNTLHMMYHEATACHVTGDLVELLSIFLSVLKATRPYLQRKAERREARRAEPTNAPSEEAKDEKEAGSKTGGSATPLSEDSAFPSAVGPVGEGPEGCGGPAPSSSSSPQVLPSAAAPPPDMLDMLYRTVEATIAIVTKLSVKGPPSS
ncbi:Ubiquitin carboxyl-terminal hydrolase 34 [Liparis tanakae]|uniref:Ubiquitin carboxyl-terminal hydrolase 34 n=1 Tax=Liparis tanakae TaxID=230148 RepID=A0A4Z2H5X6_9TELE|nr:Ubiquitin carboxyl-terminal hydrolase 34 [Liparis tanakae]